MLKNINPRWEFTSYGQDLRKMNITHWLGKIRAWLLHWPCKVNTNVRDDGKILFGKLSPHIIRAVKQQAGTSVFETVAPSQLRPEEDSKIQHIWASIPSDCVKQGGEGASITGIPLKLWDVLQFWKRAPNLNTCSSDIVRHKLTQTRKSRGLGVRLQGLSLWKHAL